MEVIRKLETIENEFVEQLQKLLYSSFPKMIGFKLLYCVGENSEGTRGLYFEIVSKKFGIVYNRFKPMRDHQVVADIEDKFINNMINDLVLAGFNFLNIESLKKQQDDAMIDATLSENFKNVLPSRIIFLN